MATNQNNQYDNLGVYVAPEIIEKTLYQRPYDLLKEIIKYNAETDNAIQTAKTTDIGTLSAINHIDDPIENQRFLDAISPYSEAYNNINTDILNKDTRDKAIQDINVLRSKLKSGLLAGELGLYPTRYYTYNQFLNDNKEDLSTLSSEERDNLINQEKQRILEANSREEINRTNKVVPEIDLNKETVLSGLFEKGTEELVSTFKNEYKEKLYKDAKYSTEFAGFSDDDWKDLSKVTAKAFMLMKNKAIDLINGTISGYDKANGRLDQFNRAFGTHFTSDDILKYDSAHDNASIMAEKVNGKTILHPFGKYAYGKFLQLTNRQIDINIDPNLAHVYAEVNKVKGNNEIEEEIINITEPQFYNYTQVSDYNLDKSLSAFVNPSQDNKSTNLSYYTAKDNISHYIVGANNQKMKYPDAGTYYVDNEFMEFLSKNQDKGFYARALGYEKRNSDGTLVGKAKYNINNDRLYKNFYDIDFDEINPAAGTASELPKDNKFHECAKYVDNKTGITFYYKMEPHIIGVDANGKPKISDDANEIFEAREKGYYPMKESINSKYTIMAYSLVNNGKIYDLTALGYKTNREKYENIKKTIAKKCARVYSYTVTDEMQQARSVETAIFPFNPEIIKNTQIKNSWKNSFSTLFHACLSSKNFVKITTSVNNEKTETKYAQLTDEESKEIDVNSIVSYSYGVSNSPLSFMLKDNTIIYLNDNTKIDDFFKLLSYTTVPGTTENIILQNPRLVVAASHFFNTTYDYADKGKNTTDNYVRTVFYDQEDVDYYNMFYTGDIVDYEYGIREIKQGNSHTFRIIKRNKKTKEETNANEETYSTIYDALYKLYESEDFFIEQLTKEGTNPIKQNLIKNHLYTFANHLIHFSDNQNNISRKYSNNPRFKKIDDNEYEQFSSLQKILYKSMYLNNDIFDYEYSQSLRNDGTHHDCSSFVGSIILKNNADITNFSTQSLIKLNNAGGKVKSNPYDITSYSTLSGEQLTDKNIRNESFKNMIKDGNIVVFENSHKGTNGISNHMGFVCRFNNTILLIHFSSSGFAITNLNDYLDNPGFVNNLNGMKMHIYQTGINSMEYFNKRQK